ncbi:hypothetical protein PQX77_006492 [Marasmius sp. AFHP31]|nr:hypothetical protein PQX77_006492 [Marasmius sp. AFHP31]
MGSLEHHQVYQIIQGRVLDNNDPPVKDVISKGITQLSGPLREYNAAFKSLQARRQQEPTVGGFDPGISRRDDSVALAEGHEEEQIIEGVEVEDFDEGVTYGNVFQGEMAEVSDREDQMLSLLTEEDVALDMNVFEQ